MTAHPMNKGSDAELLPCPFCGDRSFIAYVNEARQGWCTRDFCSKGPLRETEADAIAAWNTRALTKVEDTE